MQKIIGVTGGFGVGKSTFCLMAEKLGALWIDADSLTHELYKPGRVGYEKIRGYFGEAFVDPKKGVKRAKLRRIVLQNPQKLWILNKLIHPLLANEVSKKINQRIRSAAKDALKKENQIILVEAFYFEKDDLGTLVDEILLVERNPNLVKKSRKKEEKWNDEDIKRFMRIQPLYPKPKWVIGNNGSLPELKEKAQVFYDKMQKEYGDL